MRRAIRGAVPLRRPPGARPSAIARAIVDLLASADRRLAVVECGTAGCVVQALLDQRGAGTVVVAGLVLGGSDTINPIVRPPAGPPDGDAARLLAARGRRLLDADVCLATLVDVDDEPSPRHQVLVAVDLGGRAVTGRLALGGTDEGTRRLAASGALGLLLDELAADLRTAGPRA